MHSDNVITIYQQCINYYNIVSNLSLHYRDFYDIIGIPMTLLVDFMKFLVYITFSGFITLQTRT